MCRGHFLAACIGIFLSWHYHGLSVATEPGFLDFDNLPETNFSCEGKVIGGYYADTETGCQMFHVCTIGQKGEVTDIKFLCLNGTVFDQETRVCERLDEVDCSKSESFYDLNLELYGNHGAGYGIQPENEEVQEDQLCQEEDEEDCKTERPSKPNPTEQVHSSSEETEDEETTTQQPFLSSTTSRRPVATSTSFPSTTPAPQILQFPSSSPETIAALLALHKAFTQSLQQHSNNKDAKVNIPKLTGFVESIDPIKANQHAETFELEGSPPAPPPRPPTPFPTKTQTQFNVQQDQPKPQFSNPQKPLFHSPSKPQYQNQPVIQTHQPQSKPQFQKPQFRPQSKLPPLLPLPPLSFPKPIQSTSERYGTNQFHHSFHINSQVGHFPDPNYQDHYDNDPQPSPQSQTDTPKQYDFEYDEDYYDDEKTHSSTITPYQLHQLKVNQVKSANQGNKPSSNHGSFVREVSNPVPTKAFNVPTLRSVTPSIAIITATSTTSSSSVKTGKPVQSAIPSSKDAAGFTDSSNTTHQSFVDSPQSYDYYTEGDVRSDPFYKDVPKINRNKRSLENNLISDSSVTFLDYVSLTKLKDNLLNSVFKNSSQTILRAILQQYCNDRNDSNTSSTAYCVFVRNSNISDTELGKNWRVVAPKDNSDYIYLIKTIISSNEYENSTSNILLLVNFPDEFKLIRDSILKSVKQDSTDIVKNIVLNNTNSSMHHRFKRVKRNKIVDNSLSRKPLKTALKQITKLKKKRKKRQANSPESEEIANAQQETPRVTSRSRARDSSQVIIRRRPVKVLDSADESDEPRTQIRPRQRRPSSRRQPQQTVSQSSAQHEVEEATPRSTIRTLPNDSGITTPASQSNEDKRLGRPTSRRRGQGVRYHFSENPQLPPGSSGVPEPSTGNEETATVYPFNLKPGTQFSCDDKIKGGYYADVEAQCYGYFICSQGEVNGPLLKSHFWCGPTTKFNQRSRTCQVEANVACAVSERYFYLNKDILSLPDPDVDVKDTFEPSKVKQ